jgi:serine phosphatase RsbU (regulator of sigma subunit)
MKARIFFLFFSVLLVSNSISGNGIDSLKAIIASGASDSIKVIAYLNLSYAYANDPDKILELVSEMSTYCETRKDKRTKALWWRKIGTIYHKHSFFDKALEYTLRSAALFEEMNDKAGLANCYNNIGNSYAGKGILTNDQALFDRAIDYHLKCIKLRVEIKDTNQLRNSYNNIGIGYMSKKEFQKALDYFDKAYKEYSKPPVDKNGVDMVMLNMGDAYLAMALRDKQPEYFKKALVLLQNRLATFGNSESERISNTLTRIGMIYSEMGDVTKALAYLTKAMNMADAIKDKAARLEAAEQLAKVYEKTGDFKKANENLLLFMSLKDSLINERNSQNIEQMQALYQSSRKDQEIQKLNADKQIQGEKLNRQRIAIFSVIGGLLLILVLGFVLLSRYNLKKKANKQLSEAYNKIELKNRQITDSINYAKRIQNSILPPSHELERCLQDFFVFYTPKDIVSGDFYWFSKVGGRLFFVVADCTGHGVPGALMSMIGNTLLNEIINQKSVFDPGEILYHLDKGVTTALHQQDRDLLTQDDGMDISICSVSEKDHTQLKYATANHSIFIKHGSTVQELKGDIFSIGGSIGGSTSENHRQFETREVKLEKGTFVIMSTDGYYDQFGGDNDTKFLVTKFEELILKTDLQKEPISAFKVAFENWKGVEKQTDDILVAGFKV